MTRQAAHRVYWSVQSQAYEVRSSIEPVADLLLDNHIWLKWLEEIKAFAFSSRTGAHCTVLKERVQRGGAYWYAYRTLGGRTRKRYLGKTDAISIHRLEEVATRLEHERPEERSRPQQKKSQVKPVMSLLASRALPPRLPTLLIDRGPLLEKLDASLAHSLTLIQAPAGFGKTTAVLEWLTIREITGFGWISLDTSDNDPVHFWRTVINACQQVHSTIGRHALARLLEAEQPPFETLALEAMVTLLLNDIVYEAQRGIIVLDDYHVITGEAIQSSLTFFIDHLPPGFCVLLLSRTEPVLPLLRWRVEGKLAEIYTGDLRFSPEETSSLISQALQIDLSAKALDQIGRILEGWAVGLRLLTFSVRRQQAPQEIERVLLALSGQATSAPAYQPLADYLAAEVFNQQPASLQMFLLQTCALPRLTGSLCDAVTREKNSGALLVSMEQAGLFLEQIGEEAGWYRYHTFFAEMLRREAMKRLDVASMQETSRRASKWYEQQAMPVEAINFAVQGQDFQRALVLIEQADRGEQTYEGQIWYQWLDPVPETLLGEYPALCLRLAIALRFHKEEPTGSRKSGERIEALLQMIEDYQQGKEDLSWSGMVAAFRAMSAWRMEQQADAIRWAQQALTLLPQQNSHRRMLEWRHTCLVITAVGCMYEGRFRDAQQLMLEIRNAIEHDKPFMRMVQVLLGLSCFIQGELHQAAEYYRQALVGARKQEDHEGCAMALVSLAELSFERNNLIEAEKQAHEVIEILQDDTHEVYNRAVFILARLEDAAGRTAMAHQQFAMLHVRLQTIAKTWVLQLLQQLLIWQACRYLRVGDWEAARHYQDMMLTGDSQFDMMQRLLADMLQVRFWLAQGQTPQALLELERLLPVAKTQRLVYNALEIQLLLVLTHAQAGHEQQAYQWLETTLVQTLDKGFVRLFLTEGEPLLQVLRQLLPRLQDGALRSSVRTLLHASVTPQKHLPENAYSHLLEPLSAQESRVLQMIVAGLTNLQIAHELVISINTVKGHVKNLYRKLGVTNRLQAIQEARHLSSRSYP